MTSGKVLMVALLTAAAGFADTLTWCGASGGYWADAANWRTQDNVARLPADGDDVVFPAGGSSGAYINITNATPHLASLTVYQSKTLNVYGWDTKLHADTMTFSGSGNSAGAGNDMNARICVASTSNATRSNRVWIVADTLSMNNRSCFYGSGWGDSLGPCWDGVSSKSGPGAHGGLAASGNAKTYGSVTAPLEPGAGGAGGAAGGPAIRIEVNALTVNGLITADGNFPWNSGNPAGAGGSVYISCKTISGTGTISANGGGNTSGVKERAVSGGGGRVAIHYDADLQKAVKCDVNFSARGGMGWGPSYSTATRYESLGRAGTVWFTDDTLLKRAGVRVAGKSYYGTGGTRFTGWSGADLAFTNTLFELEAGDAVNVTGNLSFVGDSGRAYGIVCPTATDVRVGGDLSLSGANVRFMNGGSLAVGGNCTFVAATSDPADGEISFQAAPTNGAESATANTITVGGKWLVGAHGGIFPKCSSTNGASVVMRAGAFQLDATAQISATLAGWAGKYGPGKSSDYRYGASYGGRGVHYKSKSTYESPSRCYGDCRRPVDPGSGAIGEGTRSGSSGGGVVWLETVRSMTLNGRIEANSGSPGLYASAGSGGGVYLRCGGRLCGTTGVIEAKGGNPGSSYNYGAGGGGRVAIWYGAKAANLNLSVDVSGGTGTAYAGIDRADGEEGTVYWRHAGPLVILLR